MADCETHPQRRLARYEWSTSEGVLERIDRHGSDSDWYMRNTPDGLQAYPRILFPCPLCEDKKKNRSTNTKPLQDMLQKAAGADRFLLTEMQYALVVGELISEPY